MLGEVVDRARWRGIDGAAVKKRKVSRGRCGGSGGAPWGVLGWLVCGRQAGRTGDGC